MKFLIALKKAVFFLIKGFFVVSGLTVAILIGIAAYAYFVYEQETESGNIQIVSYEEGEEEESETPLWQKYEHTASHYEIVEDAKETGEFDGIELQFQSLEVLEKIVVALEMMRREVPADYDYVRDAIKIIREDKRTYARPSEGLMSINRRSTGGSVLWTAGVLYHEAVHLDKHKHRSGTAAEREANEGQRYILERLDAPKRIIESVGPSGGEHWDVDKNGRYTHRDFLLQDW